MYKLVRISKKELAKTIHGLQWLANDSKEALELAAADIPTLILKQQKVEPITFIVVSEMSVLSIIMIDFEGSLTYFNTENMNGHTIGYLRFIKKELTKYMELFDVELTVDAMAWYTTSIKKLVLLGFKQIDRYKDRITYGISV